jgi:hypothetical protein
MFGNIQDHDTCYPSHDDASSKTNGFPGRPDDIQGGNYFSTMPCPAQSAASSTGPSKTAAGWGHGEMMGAIPYPYYYAWWE